MNKWKISFFVCLGIGLASTTFLLYLLVDQTVTYSYQVTHIAEQAQAKKLLGSLVVAGAKDYTQQDVLHLLRQSNPDAFIIEEGHLISIEGVIFAFENDQLVAVK